MVSHKFSLVCHPYYPNKCTGRGQDRYAFEILSYMLRHELNVEVLHTGISSSIHQALIREIFFPLRLLPEKADLFHAIDPIGAKSVAILEKFPLVTTVHDLIPFHFGGIKHEYQRFCTKLAVEKSERLIVPYHITADEIHSLFGVPQRKMHVINYGIDHGFFFPRRVKKFPRKTVLYVGEISKFKGVDVLITAFSLVKREIKDAQLVVGGKGKDTKEMVDLADRLGLHEQVKFLGFVPEDKLPEHYSSADVSVFPSKFGFGLPTLEAMACGSPVIAGDSLDASEFVGDAGLLVDPRNAHEVAQAITHVLTTENREALSKKSVEKAKQYSWAKTAEKTIEVYEDALRD